MKPTDLWLIAEKAAEEIGGEDFTNTISLTAWLERCQETRFSTQATAALKEVFWATNRLATPATKDDFTEAICCLVSDLTFVTSGSNPDNLDPTNVAGVCRLFANRAQMLGLHYNN